MPSKKAAPVFDISQYQPLARYHWREIEREDAAPLRVRLRDLSIGQTNAIPYGLKVPLTDAFAVIAPYVAEWDLRAVNTATGEEVDVPPPAEAGPGVLELLDSATGALLVTWLKAPHAMQAAAEKKSPSETASS